MQTAYLVLRDTRMTETQQSIARLLEYAYVLIVFVMCMDGFRLIFNGIDNAKTTATTEANLGFQIFSGSLYLIAAVMVSMRLGDLLSLFRRNWALLLLLAIIVISAAWSLSPLVTLRRAAAFLLTVGFAIYLSMRFRP